MIERLLLARRLNLPGWQDTANSSQFRGVSPVFISALQRSSSSWSAFGGSSAFIACWMPVKGITEVSQSLYDSLHRGAVESASDYKGHQMTRKVIVIGSDAHLIESRALVLRSRNYQTICGQEKDAASLIQSERFDLLLLCSSLSSGSATAVSQTFKQHAPKTPILQLVASDPADSVPDVADDVVTIDYRPLTWLSAVDRLLSS